MGSYSEYRKNLRQERAKTCEVCSSQYAVVAHHRDTNPRNNNVSNLQWLCASCHKKAHDKTCNVKLVFSRQIHSSFTYRNEEAEVLV
jgi:5-methylcytosine-specific restriction endonuclease McrA